MNQSTSLSSTSNKPIIINDNKPQIISKPIQSSSQPRPYQQQLKPNYFPGAITSTLKVNQPMKGTLPAPINQSKTIPITTKPQTQAHSHPSQPNYINEAFMLQKPNFQLQYMNLQVIFSQFIHFIL